MKCEKCGENNSDKNKFCRNCGNPINLKITCSKCGKKIERGIKFCSYCGAKINNISKKRNQTSKARYSRKNKKAKNNNTSKIIAISIIAALVISIIVMNIDSFTSSSSSNNNNNNNYNLNSGAGDNITWSEQVQRIAANFYCPCEKCGIISLDKCTCDIEKGSVEVKSFIINLLDKEFSEEEVIQKVDEVYGHRI